MINKVLDEIVTIITQRLQDEYGYCGIATGDASAMLNSGKDTDIIITIKEKPTGGDL